MKARRWRDGIFEYLVVWEPKSNGDPWDDTWEPENYITEELKESFKSTLALSKQVRVDVAPLLTFVRQKVAHAVAFAKTQCRPREHCLPLECLSLQEIAVAFLELARSPTSLSMLDYEEGGEDEHFLGGQVASAARPDFSSPRKGERPGVLRSREQVCARPYPPNPPCSHVLA